MSIEQIESPGWWQVITKQMIRTESNVRLLQHGRSELNEWSGMMLEFYAKKLNEIKQNSEASFIVSHL